MTNQANYIPITYQCNGITKDFAFNWKIMDDDDLVVELIEVATGEIVVLEKNKYTVDYGEMGGSITTIETYSADYQLKISRNTPLFQNKSFTTSSGFQATEIEKALDKTSCQMQDLVYNEEQFEIKTGVEIEEFKDEVNTKVAELEVDVNNANETANNAMETLNNFLDDPNAKKVSEIEAVVKNQVLTSQEITDTILNAQEAREIATSANETSQEAREIATSANETSQEALDVARVAGLTPKGAYNSATVYDKNDFVYKTTASETAYYISNQNVNQGHDVEDTEYWTFFLRQIVGEGVEWGNIVGDIFNQRDLKAKFDEVNNSINLVDGRVDETNERINDLEVSKMPNATPIGNLNIDGSFVSGFSENDYYQFPFIDISHGLPFELYFSFTTGADVLTQQNILDSYFGIALAIQNGKGVMALSSNGSSWDIGLATGTQTLRANTTYYAKMAWTGTQYTTALSTDGETYNPDMILNSSLSPNKTTIYIGASPNIFGAGTSHPFKGTINFNGAKVIVNGNVEWDGYADVGFQTRADISLSNIDEAGKEVIRNVSQEELNIPYTLLESKYSDIEITNASWIKSKGQWNTKAMYPSAYEEVKRIGVNVLGENYNGYSRQGDTTKYYIKGSTVSIDDDVYYENWAEPHDIRKSSNIKVVSLTANGFIDNYGLEFTRKTEWDTFQGSYTDYDFVYNEANETFRLPLKNGTEDMPSTKYDSLTLGASGTRYTAPANGWFYLEKVSTAVGQYQNLKKVDENNVTIYADEKDSSKTGNSTRTLLFVKKDDIVGVGYNLGGNTNAFRFIYAQGNGDLYYYVGDVVQNASLIDVEQVTTALANKVDINSNIIDGQWVYSYFNVSSAITVGTYYYSLSDYLPNDNYAYEVMFSFGGYRNGTSSTAGECSLGNTQQSIIGYCSVSANSRGSYNSPIIPVLADRQIKIIISGTDFTSIVCRAVAYRRIGTNE